ncbi:MULTISPECIES: winged helix-turn-helix domain-containing protein [Asticcacaulis]|uniref:winged helix-turn-helix domain-containing protein n=1 Tax=Asticcacaulis TaxID=76890 RepID=UPI001AE6AA84|nr:MULTISPECIES: winged helix-turn-helix domain-containing protein [Asticcacaulis]MBP2159311.1 Tol biopolymer transport system component/DNA-binding winged helix-turn-helix (wHTH) protein [Asticcacaulis solisilvae]MDR6800356.1 Tol biopolymer transport system component/DNA-binding winged helix-turn-helix (wHTH) protein [Asticcacaulis sp. BE141]
MNVLTRLQLESGIRLADLPVMRLGKLTVKPSTLEVSGPDGTVALEPRCMKVLVVFHEHIGRTVSRDLLIDRCWDGRIVTDGALNRCVAQIRRALGADPDIVIDTIPRVGYCLKAPAEPAAEPPAMTPASAAQGVPADAPPPGGRSAGKRILLIAAAAAALVLAVAGAVYLSVRPSNWQGEEVRPLTSEPGVESFPAMAPDGRRLAYAKTSRDGSWDIYIKSVDGSGLRAVTQSPANEWWPAWRDDGEALAFIRLDDARCDIVTLDLITMTETLVTACNSGRVGRVSWAGRSTLIYSDAAPNADQRLVYQFNLDTRQKTALTTPPPSSHGDMDPIVSPDGKRVLFRRTVSWGVDDLMVGELRAQGGPAPGRLDNVRALTNDGWKAHGVAWSSDGRDIFFTSNRGGDWGLWSLPASGGQPRRVSLGTAAITKIGSAGIDRLAVEIYHPRSDLTWLGGEMPTTSMTADSWTPAVGPQGQVAFVSNQSGGVELWLLENGRTRQLTHLGASYLHGPNWAASGDAISFIAIVDRTPQIFSIATDGRPPVQLTRDDGDKAEPAYLTGTNRLIYLGRSATGWRVMEVSANGPARHHAHLGDQWESLATGQNQTIGLKRGDPYLYRLDVAGGAVTAVKTAILRPPGAYAVTSDGVVQISGDRVMRVNWDGSAREIARLPAGKTAPAEIDMDGRTGSIVMIDRSGNEANIALMTLRRQ